MRKEIEEYCISDVKLLKAGCEKFQNEFSQPADFKPMEKCITIASACNRFWRKKLLPKDTIAVETPCGWFGATTNASTVARQWLAYKNHVLRLFSEAALTEDPIKTACNGGEVRIFTPAESYLVDGYDSSTKTVYEFHGCLWHGCPNCFPNRKSYSKLNADRTFQELYEAKIMKESLLCHFGYKVTVMWECQWTELKKGDEFVIEFMSRWHDVELLNPRDAFFGGRTNAVTLYRKIDETVGEEIQYIDVTSVYLWVNANGEYPVGHPKVITDPRQENINAYFGMAKVTILPPAGLFHLVLPLREGGKLTFPLYASCVKTEIKKPLLERRRVCLHSPEERMMCGTWCTPEIAKAISKGYKLIKIHEVWHFEKREKGLFQSCVCQWLKIKQESTGYPSWVNTEEDKTKYIEDYEKKEGIKIELSVSLETSLSVS